MKGRGACAVVCKCLAAEVDFPAMLDVLFSFQEISEAVYVGQTHVWRHEAFALMASVGHLRIEQLSDQRSVLVSETLRVTIQFRPESCTNINTRIRFQSVSMYLHSRRETEVIETEIHTPWRADGADSREPWLSEARRPRHACQGRARDLTTSSTSGRSPRHQGRSTHERSGRERTRTGGDACCRRNGTGETRSRSQCRCGDAGQTLARDLTSTSEAEIDTQPGSADGADACEPGRTDGADASQTRFSEAWCPCHACQRRTRDLPTSSACCSAPRNQRRATHQRRGRKRPRPCCNPSGGGNCTRQARPRSQCRCGDARQTLARDLARSSEAKVHPQPGRAHSADACEPGCTDGADASQTRFSE